MRPHRSWRMGCNGMGEGEGVLEGVRWDWMGEATP